MSNSIKKKNKEWFGSQCNPCFDGDHKKCVSKKCECLCKKKRLSSKQIHNAIKALNRAKPVKSVTKKKQIKGYTKKDLELSILLAFNIAGYPEKEAIKETKVIIESISKEKMK
jgi:hypothetical protein